MKLRTVLFVMTAVVTAGVGSVGIGTAMAAGPVTNLALDSNSAKPGDTVHFTVDGCSSSIDVLFAQGSSSDRVAGTTGSVSGNYASHLVVPSNAGPGAAHITAHCHGGTDSIRSFTVVGNRTAGPATPIRRQPTFTG